ncbi:hypothetical protein [Desulfallas thermosapovorans]|uniref:Uncharacterized protein n=1 Tax=Desulfallas thermosapovorans DSM 6562 TaxID=1121431 RepID=A0A5S4ZSD8_9FIRM|nr:hypothetical protein [Desulfallas thermosapovorans]TYO95572.1 hypothetical protein LX24_01534 [Desulfallas thermosapovorans DSM 6562]
MRKDFFFWGAKLERWLLRVVVMCAVMLVAVQWFTNDPALQVIGKADESIMDQDGFVRTDLNHLVTIQLLDYTSLPKAAVLVNGEKKGYFKHRYVTVPVTHGDELAIDACFYEHPASFKIIETYGNVTRPSPGTIIEVHGTTKTIGTVEVDKSTRDSR